MHERLRELLTTPAYRSVVRGYLIGLDQALADVCRYHPDTAAEAVRRDLATLLDERAPGPPAGSFGPPPPVIDSGLRTEFAADPEVAAHLGGTPVADVPALFAALLRLPAGPAATWRARAAAGETAGGETAGGDWADVPSFVDRETLIPPDPATGRPGLRLRPETPLPADVAEALALRAGDHGPGYRLAVAAVQVLAVAGRDGTLVDLLPTRNGLPAGRFDQPGTPTACRSELLRRLHAHTAATTPGERLRTLLDVDEALCSVVHRPPAAAGSWWANLATQVRDLVFQAARDVPGAQVTELSGRFSDIPADMTSDNAAMLGGPGTVLACLRLWASVDGRTIPGRVIIGTR